MVYEIRVGPAEPSPTHHIKLSKDGVDVGLILCDPQGKPDVSITRDMVPREAIKMYEGEQKHSDMSGPYRTLAQDTLSGGRGNKWYEDDASRYYDGIMDTHHDRVTILPPLYQYGQGHRDQYLYWPDQLSDTYKWVGLYDSTQYIARKFTIPSGGGFTAYYYEVFLRKVGSPGSPTIRLRNDNAGAVGTVRITPTITTNGTPTDIIGRLCLAFGSSALSASTSYWLEVSDLGSPDEDDHWEVLVNNKASDATSKVSDDGSSWSNSAYRVYHRVSDYQSFINQRIKFFEYRGALYFATWPDDGSAGQIFLNGDRGSADDNTGVETTLIDATKSWTTNRWDGAVVQIVNGEGYDETRNWREIESNTGTVLTCDDGWIIIHEPGGSYVVGVTEYVIKRTPWFEERHTGQLDRGVRDVIYAGGNVYLAQGESFEEYDKILSMYDYVDRSDGSFNHDLSAHTGTRASFLARLKDPKRGDILYWLSQYGTQGFGAVANFGNVPAYNDWLVGHMELFNSSTWNTDTNDTGVTAGTNTWGDRNWNVADSYTTGIIFTQAFPSARDIRFGEYIGLYIRTSIGFPAGSLQILIDDSSGCGSPLITLDLPAIKADTYSWILLPYDAIGEEGAENAAYAGINVAVEQISTQFYIALYGMYVFDEIGEVKLGDGTAQRITGVTEYGEPEGIWVFLEDGFGEIRNNMYMPSPLSKQFASLRNIHNGRNPLAHDVYLYFPFGERGGYQRYYQNTLTSIGLDRDEGLPADRAGPIYDSASFGSMMFHCVNGGEDNYSSIWCLKGSTWHEFFRSPRPGMMIRDIYIQSMPGPYPPRLWFSMGGDPCYMDIDLHPLQSEYMMYSHQGHIITSYVHGGMLDVEKLFTSLKVHTNNLSATRKIAVDYRLDTDVTWTELEDPFILSPSEEITIDDEYDVSGKWIQFRFRFENDDVSETHELYSWAVELILMADIKFQYSMTFRLADNDQNLANVFEGKASDGAGVDEKTAVLEGWIDDRAVVTMNSLSTMENNKQVQFVGMPLRRLHKVYETEGNKDVYIAQLTVLELE